VRQWTDVRRLDQTGSTTHRGPRHTDSHAVGNANADADTECDADPATGNTDDATARPGLVHDPATAGVEHRAGRDRRDGLRNAVPVPR
jgi:hypothetical protein